MKALFAALALATLIAAPAFTQSAAASWRSLMCNSARRQERVCRAQRPAAKIDEAAETARRAFERERPLEVQCPLVRPRSEQNRSLRRARPSQNGL
jgi:hypothetical protein